MTTYNTPGLRKALIGAMLVAMAATAHADITGDQVRVDYYLNDVVTPQTQGDAVTVGAGVEYDPFNVQASDSSSSFSLGTIDFTGSTINIMLDVGNYAGAVCPAGWCSFDGLRITNLSHAGSFGGYNVAMTLGTDLAAFQKDGNGNLWLNFAGSDLYANNAVTLTLASTSPVPEPASLALMLGGGGLLWARRRNARS